MRRILALSFCLTLFSSAAFADIRIENVRSFETSNGIKNGAVLLTIINNGKEADTLIAASSPSAKETQIHEMSEDNGIMRMRQVKDVTIEAGKTVAFSANGYHLMLINLKAPLKPDQTFPLTLTFKKAGKIQSEFTVKTHSALSESH